MPTPAIMRAGTACPCGASAQYHGRHEKTFESVRGPCIWNEPRMTGSTAALASFGESSALLHELAGVEVGAKQVERAAEGLGAVIAADERPGVEKMGAVAPTMYLGMDGAGVPMCASEVAGRAGKQPDGSAKTREVNSRTQNSKTPKHLRSSIRHTYGSIARIQQLKRG
jgi:hypothetical protein